jgi:hypothetical protein
MIAVGLPHGEAQDEDSLNREHDDNGGDDLATEAIVNIVRSLHEGGPSAVRDLRRLTAALEDISSAFMERDHQGLEDAASDARDVLHEMLTE